MRSALAAIVAVAAALVAANMLGVASAEAPTTTATQVRTVSVEGVAGVPIPEDANLTEAKAVYRQGMASALSDGQEKAEFLASKAGATLGSVQSIAEGGGSIECSAKAVTGEGEGTYYEPYEGEQPDFGPGEAVVAHAVAAPAPAPGTEHSKRKKKHTSAKKASAVSCTLRARVSLAYALS